MAALPRAEEGASTRRTGSYRWGDAQGSMITEYAMLLVFISLAAVIGMVVLGGGMRSLFDAVGEQGTQEIQPGVVSTGASGT